MTIKNRSLNPVLFQTIESLSKDKVHIKLAWKLTKIRKELSGIAELLETSRMDLIKKWAKKDESGNPVHPKLDNGEDDTTRFLVEDGFHEELNTLMEQENEVSFEKLKLEDLIEGGLEQISAMELSALSPIMED